MLENLDKKQKIIIIICIIAVLLLLLSLIISSINSDNKNAKKISEVYLKASIVDENTLNLEIEVPKDKMINYTLEKSNTLNFEEKEEVKGSTNTEKVQVDTKDIDKTVYYRVKMENMETKEISYSNVISVSPKEENIEIGLNGEKKSGEESDNNSLEIEERSDEKSSSKSKSTEKDEKSEKSINKDSSSNKSSSSKSSSNESSSKKSSSSKLSKSKSKKSSSKSRSSSIKYSYSKSNTEYEYDYDYDYDYDDYDEESSYSSSKSTQKSSSTSKQSSSSSKTNIEIKNEEKIIEVKSVKLNTSNIELDISGKNTRKLELTINPENATDKTITWISENEKIVKVDNKGTITAVSNGQTNIIAKVGKKQAKCRVKVITTATGIRFDKTNLKIDLTKNKQEQIEAKIEPETATNTKITWSSEDTKIARVDSKGMVTGVANGKTNIIAKIGTITKECEVTVETSIKSIAIDKKSIELDINQNNQEKINVKTVPSTASNVKIKWKSSNTKVAKVDRTGKVTAVGEGMATITAYLEGNEKIKNTVQVIVNSSISNIEVSKKNIDFDLLTYTTEKIEATVKNGEKYKAVTWTSSNESVAKVVGNGLKATITAKKEGEAIITVNIDGKTSGCTITVKKGKLEFDKNKYTIELGSNGTGKVNIIIKNEIGAKNIKYTSSDSNIAEVDSNGLVTGKKVGNVKITVETDRCIGSCQVEVKKNSKVDLRERIVEYAKRFVGARYVFGTKGPNTFDCSGLVLYVYNHFGYVLPHKAEYQSTRGVEVSIYNLQPADLLFYANEEGDIIHVSMYIGNEKIIHATGSGVVIQNINRGPIVKARRIIK